MEETGTDLRTFLRVAGEEKVYSYKFINLDGVCGGRWEGTKQNKIFTKYVKCILLSFKISC